MCESRGLSSSLREALRLEESPGGGDGAPDLPPADGRQRRRLGPVRPPQLPEGVDQAQRKALVQTRSTALFTWEDGGGGEAARGVVSGAAPAAGRQERGDQSLALKGQYTQK